MSFRLDLAYSSLMCKLRYAMHQTYSIIINPIMFWMEFYVKDFKSFFLKRLWLSWNWFALERILPLVISCNTLIRLIHRDASKLSSCCVLLLCILTSWFCFMGPKLFLKFYFWGPVYSAIPHSRPFVSIFSSNTNQILCKNISKVFPRHTISCLIKIYLKKNTFLFVSPCKTHHFID